MHTIVVTEFGDPDVLQLRDAPAPHPGPGEVAVEVQAVEVLFLDTQVRSGWARDYFPMRPPFVPGTGVAGIADGRRVVARTGNEGAYAQRVVVPVEEAIPVPDGVDLAVALAAVHDGVLAQHRLEQARLGTGSRVLVTAAAGSLGQWFVPLAKAAGARVVGAAGGPAKQRAVRELGADVAVDYSDDDWLERAGGEFDVVFDGAGGEIGRAALSRTAAGGRFFAHGAASGSFAEHEDEGDIDERGITVVGVEQPIGDEDWHRLELRGLDLLAAGRVRPTIGQRIPLAHAAAAHRAIERREVIGKSVLIV